MLEKIIAILSNIFGIRYNTKKEGNNKCNTTQASYFQKPFMTAAEYEFFLKIKPLEKDFIIVPQLNLASIIGKKSNLKYRSELFRNIDFAIFSKDYKDLLLLIELNDKTHNFYNRKSRDRKVKNICASANIKLIIFYTTYPNKEDYVINRILKSISITEEIEILNTDEQEENIEIL